MSEDNTKELSLRYLPFKGKKEEWEMWSAKFLSKARKKKYLHIITANKPIEFDDPDDKTTEEQAKEKLNDEAYDDLITSMEDKIAFSKVAQAKTATLPNGCAHTAWKNLTNKYKPRTVQSKAEKKLEFAQSKLSDWTKDPDEWLDELERIRADLEMMKSEISDEDFKIHVLNNLPKEYESIIEKLIPDISILDIGDMREELQAKYNRLMKYNEGSNNEEDQALVSNQGFKQFKGKCLKCGKIGHKAANCRSGQKFNGNCHYCGKPGHRIAECRKKKREERNGSSEANVAMEEVVLLSGEPKMNYFCQEVKKHCCQDVEKYKHRSKTCEINDTMAQEEVVLMATNESNKFTKETWVGDTGATSHMTNSDKGLINAQTINEQIRVGNGKYMIATKKGRLPCTIKQTNGEDQQCTLEVKVVPELWCNLFSITSAMKKGFAISSKDMVVSISKGNFKFNFDKVGETASGGFLMGIEIVPRLSEQTMVSEEEQIKIKERTMDINIAHNIFGHPSEATTRSTAKKYGWTLTGDLEKCENCVLSKIRQRNLNKTTTPSSKKGERLYIDISSIKKRSYGGSKFWVLIVDDFTKMKWSLFLKKKSELSDKVVPFLKTIHEEVKVIVQTIRCDNAGENKILEENCKATTGLAHIKFQYTPRNTPQYNGVVERAFATLYGRVRAMNNAANLSQDLRDGLWTECASTATSLDNILSTNGELSPYESFYGHPSKIMNNLRTFGELGIVKTASKTQSKIVNRGEACIFVGYPSNHPSSTYRMLNLRTHKVIISRDIIWMHKMHGKDKSTPNIDGSATSSSLRRSTVMRASSMRATSSVLFGGLATRVRNPCHPMPFGRRSPTTGVTSRRPLGRSGCRGPLSATECESRASRARPGARTILLLGELGGRAGPARRRRFASSRSTSSGQNGVGGTRSS